MVQFPPQLGLHATPPPSTACPGGAEEGDWPYAMRGYSFGNRGLDCPISYVVIIMARRDARSSADAKTFEVEVAIFFESSLEHLPELEFVLQLRAGKQSFLCSE